MAGSGPIPSRPAMRVTSVTIAAPDPLALAEFYRRLLGWPSTGTEAPAPGRPANEAWAQLKPPPGETGPTLNLEGEAAFAPPVWPSEPGEQQIQTHLDLAVLDLDAAEGWARDCGAVLAAVQPQDDIRVMLDPAGHPFCLFLAPEYYAEG